jgi:hypothetical protein
MRSRAVPRTTAVRSRSRASAVRRTSAMRSRSRASAVRRTSAMRSRCRTSAVPRTTAVRSRAGPRTGRSGCPHAMNARDCARRTVPAHGIGRPPLLESTTATAHVDSLSAALFGGTCRVAPANDWPGPRGPQPSHVRAVFTQSARRGHGTGCFPGCQSCLRTDLRGSRAELDVSELAHSLKCALMLRAWPRPSCRRTPSTCWPSAAGNTEVEWAPKRDPAANNRAHGRTQQTALGCVRRGTVGRSAGAASAERLSPAEPDPKLCRVPGHVGVQDRQRGRMAGPQPHPPVRQNGGT